VYKVPVVEISSAAHGSVMKVFFRILFSRVQRPVVRNLGLILALPLFCVGQQVPVTPNQIPTVPETRDAAPKATQPGAPAQPGGGAGAPVDSNSYKVGPADVLSVRVWDEPQFSGPVAVQENGKITLPLVGDLDAGGHTPVQIEDSISKALTKYIVKPLVTVTVQEVGSRRYYMDGQINHPGEYALVVPTTILEAISKAGGTQEFANKKKIYVLRGDQRIPFNLKQVIRGEHLDQNILLKPGDHVVVP